MPHLVDFLPKDPQQPITIDACAQLVQAAHDYLVQCAAMSLQKMEAIAVSDPYWGTQVKRIRVQLPSENRPALINPAIEDHSLTEIYNYCATLERLLDALTWARDTFSDYQVARCHPTTSSKKTSIFPDNDLVLVNAADELARFEVSDVSGDKDSNQKEAKDLESLGVGQDHYDRWITKHRFWVVSPELATILRRQQHPKNAPDFRYEEHDIGKSSCVFEVLHVQDHL